MRVLYFQIVTIWFLFFFKEQNLACAERIVTDQVGLRMIVPDQPKRVIALAPSISEIVCALGRSDCLKGVTQFSDYPAYVKTLPQVGSYIRLDLERIVRLKPDLCLAVKDGNPKQTVVRLAAMGIPVYTLNPHNLDSVIQALTEVGALLHAEAKAKALTSDMTARINHVREFSRTVTRRPRVFFQIGVSPIVSAGNGSFLNELIECSGAVNLAQGGATYPRFSREQVLSMNPEILIITSMTRNTVFETVKKKWEAWPDLLAVKKHRIYILDSDILDRPTPRMVDGLEMLTRVIHPDFSPLKTRLK